MRRYLEAYLPDAGFEYAVTHRYDAVRQRFSYGMPMRTELCLLAMTNIRPGDFVRYCSAALRDLSQAEDEAMRDEAHNARAATARGETVLPRDFSIIRPSSRGCSQLLLGPARFINHDCRPNAEFRRNGKQITIRCIRPISQGDEITVYYGDNYFEPGNSECMCATCEWRGTGIFASEQEERAEPEKADNCSQRTRSHSRVASPPLMAVTPPPGAGPACECATCHAPFWAPEKWWTPDECPRCERHYKIFKHDWPRRTSTAAGTSTKRPKPSGSGSSSSSESLSDMSPPPRPPRKTSRTLRPPAQRRARSISPRRRSRFELHSDESEGEFEEKRLTLGPSILGHEARTDVLASYWGAPDGTRRRRRQAHLAPMTLSDRGRHMEADGEHETEADKPRRQARSSWPPDGEHGGLDESPIATKGKERTSELNLARFWSAGVSGRTRQQARQGRSATSTPERHVPPKTRAPRMRGAPQSESPRSVVDVKEEQDVPGAQERGSGPAEADESHGDGEEAQNALVAEAAPAAGGRPAEAAAAAEAPAAPSAPPAAAPAAPSASPAPPAAAPAAPSATPAAAPMAAPAAAAAPTAPKAVPAGAAVAPPRRVRRNLRWGSGKVSFTRPLPDVKHENT